MGLKTKTLNVSRLGLSPAARELARFLCEIESSSTQATGQQTVSVVMLLADCFQGVGWGGDRRYMRSGEMNVCIYVRNLEGLHASKG